MMIIIIMAPLWTAAGVIQRFDSGTVAAQEMKLEPAVVSEALATYGKDDPFGESSSSREGSGDERVVVMMMRT